MRTSEGEPKEIQSKQKEIRSLQMEMEGEPEGIINKLKEIGVINNGSNKSTS
jgi:hypothetical protein